jgi:hypothetical protein
VRLFELRAYVLSPTFDLPAHAADVVELAHAVEGLRPAPEFAAAWTRLLPMREIVRELTRSRVHRHLGPDASAERAPLAASARH